MDVHLLDWKKYISYYKDLSHLKREEAIQHWINHGKIDNRQFFNIRNNIDYLDWKIYKYFYEDLNMFSRNDIIKHWINHGNDENRIFFNIEDKLQYIDWDEYRNTYADLRHLTDKDCIFHWTIYGKKEGRIVSLKEDNTYELISNNSIYNYIDLSVSDTYNKNKNIIISLTSIPSRFICNDFVNVIDNLYLQICKPKYIIIILCNEYNRKIDYEEIKVKQRIELLKNKYDNVLIHYSKDYGPITKILGLIDLESKIEENDIIITVDDDWLFHKTMTYYYLLIHQLYQPQCVFIDQRNILEWTNYSFVDKKSIFQDKYQGSVFGWLSFSMEYKQLPLLKSFYETVIKQDINILKHDDLIITLFYKTYKLYACEISIIFNIPKETEMDKIMALRDEGDTYWFRRNLENTFYKLYDIPFTNNEKGEVSINNVEITEQIVPIKDNIIERTLLYNIENIRIEPENNDFHNIHIDYKYFTSKNILITVSFFRNIKEDEKELPVQFYIHDSIYNIILPLSNIYSTKFTFIIEINNIVSKMEHRDYSFTIFQNYNKNKISLYKLYSICSILTYIPDIKYEFYNDKRKKDYIKSIYKPLCNIYNKLVPHSYRSDLFRALYIYYNGGIYFDCKNILYQNIDSYLKDKESYTKDINGVGVYNAFIYCSYTKNINFRDYLIHMFLNIIYENYTSSSLAVTGPQLLGDYIHSNIKFENVNTTTDWMLSYLINENKDIYIKNSYNGYYNEGKYIETMHYDFLYRNKNIFNPTIVPYSNINLISEIIWINLDRCTDRKVYMENILSSIPVSNNRIRAVDGNDIHMISVSIPLERYITNYEIACIYSHLRAIQSLKDKEGEYFMICEDDISFENIYLFDVDLKTIIQNAPKFDILLLHHIYEVSLTDTYVNWNDYLNIYGSPIASASCYIISRNGLNKISSYYLEKDNIFHFYNTEKKLSVTDEYLYKNTNTWVYKYNYITTRDIESTIHNEHVNFHKTNNNNILRNLLIDKLE